MSRQKKPNLIDKLNGTFSHCNVGILTNYRGLSTHEMTILRRRLRKAGVEYKVVKNTLARFAAERAGRDVLVSSFTGPIAVAFGFGDITEPAKILTDYIRTSKASLSIEGGFLGNRLLTEEDVMTLSVLPSREILLAKILGGMQVPISTLLGRLTTPVRGFIGVQPARVKQLEGEKNVRK